MREEWVTGSRLFGGSRAFFPSAISRLTDVLCLMKSMAEIHRSKCFRKITGLWADTLKVITYDLQIAQCDHIRLVTPRATQTGNTSLSIAVEISSTIPSIEHRIMLG